MRAAWWWIDRWRKSTAYTDMTLAEQGAYRNLLDELWLRDGLLPLDERVLAKACGDALQWAEVRANILKRFDKTASGYRHETHDEIQKESQKRAERQQRYRHKTRNVTLSPSPSPSPSPSNGKTENVSAYVPPPDIRAENSIREDRWKSERRLLTVAQLIGEKEGKEPKEVMQHVTSYKRSDGTLVPGRVNPASLSYERLEKSLADAEAWLAEQPGGPA